MRIGIDARPLSRSRAGIARVVSKIVAELAEIDRGGNEYYMYSDRDFSLPAQDSRWRKRLGATLSFLPGTLWLQTEGKRLILRDRLDVFWGTVHTLPLRLPGSVRKVLTVHDLVWRLYPETMELSSRFFSRRFAERSIRQADAIAAISQSTGGDLARLLAVPEDKIAVVYNGVSAEFKPHDPVAAAKCVAGKFGVSEKYICTVGTTEPRKNLVTLVKAMKILRTRNEFRHQLLIAGAAGWKDSPIYRSVTQCGLTQREVAFLGYVPDEDLPLLYSGAAAFVFPSLYEGFGLPLIEAMACGVPVVASNAPAIPEVVRDAAVLVSPRDAWGFADAIARLAQDEPMRLKLIDKGLDRARAFSWKTAARRMLQLFAGSVDRTGGSLGGNA